MVKSKRFEPIRDLAVNSANELSRAMADAARRVAELERQQEQLKGYREQYARGAAHSGAPMDAVRMQNYRAFLDRLTEALQLHMQKLGVARADYESRRGLWSQKRIEAETLGRAVERFRTEEIQDGERREQRDGDEAAQRLALLREGLAGSR
jgi:flagellar export protein FliJ